MYRADDIACGTKDLPDYSSSHFTRSAFALIHGNYDTQCSYAETSDQAANGKLIPFRTGDDLDDNTQVENEAPEEDRPFPAESVCYRRGDQGANESTDGELPNISRCPPN